MDQDLGSTPVAATLSLAVAGVAQADTVLDMGDVTLAPGATSSSQFINVTETITGFDIAFDFPAVTDGSWSSDYLAILIDPSGDTFVFGDGFTVGGDISYSAGLPTGADGGQNGSTDEGSYGTFFTIAQVQAINPTFGETGTYEVQMQDGWANGSETVTLGNTTITFTASAVPEPASASVIGLAAVGLALVRRRRA